MEVLSLLLAAFFIVMLPVYFLFRYCFRICSEWERKVVLRLGRYAGARGPGLFFLLPFFETTPFTVDLRTVTSSISAEQTLTRDNVPVNVDTVIYWKVVDTKLAILEVVDMSFGGLAGITALAGQQAVTD